MSSLAFREGPGAMRHEGETFFTELREWVSLTVMSAGHAQHPAGAGDVGEATPLRGCLRAICDCARAEPGHLAAIAKSSTPRIYGELRMNCVCASAGMVL